MASSNERAGRTRGHGRRGRFIVVEGTAPIVDRGTKASQAGTSQHPSSFFLRRPLGSRIDNDCFISTSTQPSRNRLSTSNQRRVADKRTKNARGKTELREEEKGGTVPSIPYAATSLKNTSHRLLFLPSAVRLPLRQTARGLISASFRSDGPRLSTSASTLHVGLRDIIIGRSFGPTYQHRFRGEALSTCYVSPDDDKWPPFLPIHLGLFASDRANVSYQRC